MSVISISIIMLSYLEILGHMLRGNSEQMCHVLDKNKHCTPTFYVHDIGSLILFLYDKIGVKRR